MAGAGAGYALLDHVEVCRNSLEWKCPVFASVQPYVSSPPH